MITLYEGAFAKLTGDNKELMIIPGASHVDLYDNIAEWGEEWGTYDSLSESDWIDILENIDDYIL